MKCLRVVLIDDDSVFLSQAADLLTREKYSVAAFSDFEKAANFLRSVKGKTVILSELSVGGRCGVAFLKDTLRGFPQLPFTFLTVSPSLESVIEALKQGAYDFLRKPVAHDILRHSVARSVEKLNLSLESEKLEKEVHERLSRLQAELKQSKLNGAYKSFLVSMVGHDFTSILTVLDGYCQIMREISPSRPNPVPAQLLEQMERTIVRLRTMANTLMDYEAADKGELRIETKEFELNVLLKECVSFYRPYAKQKRINVCIEGGELPAIKAKGDPGRVMQILDNLLYNAVKFTPTNGEIRVGARYEAGKSVTVWVHDTGIGIKKSMLEKIFKEKQIVAKKDTNARIGLGLNICRKLLESQTGKIWLESEPGKGTKVFFSLPA